MSEVSINRSRKANQQTLFGKIYLSSSCTHTNKKHTSKSVHPKIKLNIPEVSSTISFFFCFNMPQRFRTGRTHTQIHKQCEKKIVHCPLENYSRRSACSKHAKFSAEEKKNRAHSVSLDSSQLNQMYLRFDVRKKPMMIQ